MRICMSNKGDADAAVWGQLENHLASSKPQLQHSFISGECLLYLCLGPRGSCLNSLWVEVGQEGETWAPLNSNASWSGTSTLLERTRAQIPKGALKPARLLRKPVTQAPSSIRWNQNLHFNKNPWQTHHSKVWEALLKLQPKWHISERASSSTSARAGLQSPHDGERNTEVTPLSAFH